MTLAEIDAALEQLGRALDDVLDAALPNPVALVFTDLPLAYQGKRDLAFALDMLNEGENECALIAGFVRDRLHDSPEADVSHLEREAWYYLRTSVDPTWQFDDAPPGLPVALAYVTAVLRHRTQATRAKPRGPSSDDAPSAAERAVLLQRLRSEWAAASTA
jgi:hypothetical protein